MTNKSTQGPQNSRAFKKRFPIVLLSMCMLLIGGASALLWHVLQGNQNSHAAQMGDVSVIGPPSLSAATVDSIFARLGSPMVGTGKAVELASRSVHIDDAFALAVWWTETNDGETGVGHSNLNPGSVRGSRGYPSDVQGYSYYPSYTTAVNYWFPLLQNFYVKHGSSTVYTIARPYVGTTKYPLWADKVITLMLHYRGEAPLSTPTPTATPRSHIGLTPTVVGSRHPQPTVIATPPLGLQQGQGGKGGHNSSTGTASIPGVQPTNNTPTSALALSRPAEVAIVCFGLLAALAIALGSLRIGQKPDDVLRYRNSSNTGVGQSTPEPMPSTAEEETSSRLWSEATTAPLPVWPQAETAVVPSGRAPRRVILLPSRTGKTPAIKPASSDGLLSRYTQSNSQYSRED